MFQAEKQTTIVLPGDSWCSYDEEESAYMPGGEKSYTIGEGMTFVVTVNPGEGAIYDIAGNAHLPYANGEKADAWVVSSVVNTDDLTTITLGGYAEPQGYSVTITPGDYMTKTTDSGAASQTGLTGAMTPVVYTANEGYYFPENYSVAEVNGISVTRNSYTQITVSGTPTADAAVTLAAPTAKTTPSAPTTAAATDCTTADNNDGKLTGVTTAMEYKKSDADSWTDGTGNDITGLVPGTYYVRIKATDTTLASDNQELTINAVAAKAHLTLNVGENGKVVMGSGIYGKGSTDGLNVSEDIDLKGKLNCSEDYFINVYEGASLNIQTGGAVSFYPAANNTGTITAVPANGYAFAGWYNGETLYSKEAALDYKIISGDLSLAAQFATVNVTGVSLEKTTAELAVDGNPLTLTATVSPNNATDKKVKWSVGGTDAGAVKLYTDADCTTEVGVDATETLTVYAKGISAGSATITATSNADNTKTASCAVTVNAAATEYPLWVGETRVTNENASNIDGNNKASYDASTNTLTLDGYEYSGSGYRGSSSTSAIFYNDTSDFTIELRGDNNTVTQTGSESGFSSNGVYTRGNLAFTGDGTLTVSSGRTSAVSRGINAKGNITISEDSKVVSTGGQSTNSHSYGVYADGNVIINGELTATGGDAKKYSIGVIAHNTTEHPEYHTSIEATGKLTAQGFTKAVARNVINHVRGNGWEDPSTDEMADIVINGEGQKLDKYRKVQFPAMRFPLNVKLVIGSGHDDYANALLEAAKDHPTSDGVYVYSDQFTLDGTTILNYMIPNIDSSGDPTTVGTVQYYFDSDAQNAGTNLQESLLYSIVAQKSSLDEYASEDQIRQGEMKSTDPITENQTFYILWRNPIDKINLQVDEPECGTDVQYEGVYPKEESMQPNVTIAEGADKVSIESEDGRKEVFWEIEGEDFPEKYVGKLKGGTEYLAGMTFDISFKYYVDKNSTKILVNNKKITVDESSNQTLEVHAPITAVHKWREVIEEPSLIHSGKAHNLCDGCGEEKDVKPIAKVFYYTVSGNGNVWTKGSNITSDFRFARSYNSKYEDYKEIKTLSKVEVDNKVLTKDQQYTTEAGSVWVKLKPSYLETLSTGKHTLKVTFTETYRDDPENPTASATVTATFTINNKSSGGGSTPKKDNVVTCQMAGFPANYAWNEAAKACQAGYVDAGGNFHPYRPSNRTVPNTSDRDIMIHAWIAMLSVTIGLFCAVKLLHEDWEV